MDEVPGARGRQHPDRPARPRPEPQGTRVQRVSGTDPARTVQVVQPPAVEGAVITDPITVQVVDHQPFADGDLALLEANGLPEATPAPPIAEEPAAIGDPLTAIGLPDTVAAVTDVTRIRASFTSGTASSSQVSPDGVAGTEVHAELSFGMSGGPTPPPESPVPTGATRPGALLPGLREADRGARRVRPPNP